jgi:hypothetical protein
MAANDSRQMHKYFFLDCCWIQQLIDITEHHLADLALQWTDGSRLDCQSSPQLEAQLSATASTLDKHIVAAAAVPELRSLSSYPNACQPTTKLIGCAAAQEWKQPSSAPQARISAVEATAKVCRFVCLAVGSASFVAHLPQQA